MHTKRVGEISRDKICAGVSASDSSDNRQNSTITKPTEVWACGSGRGVEQNRSMMRSAKAINKTRKDKLMCQTLFQL